MAEDAGAQNGTGPNGGEPDYKALYEEAKGLLTSQIGTAPKRQRRGAARSRRLLTSQIGTAPKLNQKR